MIQKEQMQLDVLRTLAKTDELMRANQMNMEVSALAPALLGLVGIGAGVLKVYRWVAGVVSGLLPHSRHENSRAAELRWFAKGLRRLDQSFLCGPESLCCVAPPPSYRWGGGQQDQGQRWRSGVGVGRQLLLLVQLMAVADDNPFSYTDDGMMELIRKYTIDPLCAAPFLGICWIVLLIGCACSARPGRATGAVARVRGEARRRGTNVPVVCLPRAAERRRVAADERHRAQQVKRLK